MVNNMKSRCIWATHFRSFESTYDDLHIVKVHEPDEYGNPIPKLKLIYNYERPFWITKKDRRTNKYKRDCEYLDNLIELKSTEAALPINIFRAINGFSPTNKPRLSEVCNSNYVYGAETPSTVLIKHDYDKTHELLPTQNIVASLDFETDMNHPDEMIFSGSLTIGDQTWLAVTHDYVKEIPDFENQLRKVIKRELNEYVEGRTIHIKVVKHAANVVRYLIDICHKRKPDFLSIWNMVFDVKKMIQALEAYGYNPADIFSDPSIPHEYRFFKFIEKPKTRVKADGKTLSFDSADLWHTVQTPSSFYIVDAMCFYRINRAAKGKMSVALDAVLNRHLNIGKMTISGLEGLSKAEWHRVAQKTRKLEYLAYNCFDTIGMEILDAKILDIRVTLTGYLGYRDLSKLKSNPSLLANLCHFHLLEKRGRVLRTTGEINDDEFTAQIQDRRNWIATLPAERLLNMGRSIVAGLADNYSRVVKQGGDNDVESSYPKTGIVANISDGTTLVEVGTIEDIGYFEFRSIGINIMSPRSNCISLAKKLFNMPHPTDVLELI